MLRTVVRGNTGDVFKKKYSKKSNIWEQLYRPICYFSVQPIDVDVLVERAEYPFLFMFIYCWIVIGTSFHLRSICFTVFCFILWHLKRAVSVGIHLLRCRDLWRYFHLISTCIINMLRDWIRIAVIMLSRLSRGLFIDSNPSITVVSVFGFMNFISITRERFARLLWPFSDTEITKANITVLLITAVHWI